MRMVILSMTMLLVIGMQLLFSCQSKYSVETMQYVANGQRVYVAHCQNCHGVKGGGLGKLYPPLTDQQYLKDHRKSLPGIVRYGIKGPMVIHGETYDGIMPGNPSLTDMDIAYVLSYVTVQFGSDTQTFTANEVKKYLKGEK